ncbi:MAG TPA: hypothetical protein VFW73_13490 [Lacipirellulaceae bacterium]|nr:hypothetical protein [Lacipirellulaceae bacterium]
MHLDPTTDDLLAHFDRPKTIDSPDFEWEENVIPGNPPEILSYRTGASHPSSSGIRTPLAPGGCEHPPYITQRGIQWVLQWAAAFAVLAFAASTLAEFACLAAAEHKFSIAARAGALEATLPRASYQSVAMVVESHLAQYPRLARHLQLTLLQGGSLVTGHIRPGDGDRISITLFARSSALLPDWLRVITFWRSDYQIQAHAERHLPGRKLAN